MRKYNSTVIRTNMPPGWPWTDSRVVMFLDQKSYPTVFDHDKVRICCRCLRCDSICIGAQIVSISTTFTL
jgi:hypothetical protein